VSKFLKAERSCRVRFNKRNTQRTNGSREGDEQGQVRAERNGLTTGTGFQALPVEFGTLKRGYLAVGDHGERGGFMFYGSIAASDRIRSSNDIKFDVTRTRPPARVPDRLMSMR
jgi:hypothetical protein